MCYFQLHLQEDQERETKNVFEDAGNNFRAAVSVVKQPSEVFKYCLVYIFRNTEC